MPETTTTTAAVTAAPLTPDQFQGQFFRTKARRLRRAYQAGAINEREYRDVMVDLLLRRNNGRVPARPLRLRPDPRK
jgi:hypothetical protein